MLGMQAFHGVVARMNAKPQLSRFEAIQLDEPQF
jgi:hypothetical protein